MAVLPYSTVSTKLFTSIHMSRIISYREVIFFLLHYCSLESLGPDFQNGADHWREIRLLLNFRVSGDFPVSASWG